MTINYITGPADDKRAVFDSENYPITPIPRVNEKFTLLEYNEEGKPVVRKWRVVDIEYEKMGTLPIECNVHLRELKRV